MIFLARYLLCLIIYTTIYLWTVVSVLLAAMLTRDNNIRKHDLDSMTEEFRTNTLWDDVYTSL